MRRQQHDRFGNPQGPNYTEITDGASGVAICQEQNHEAVSKKPLPIPAQQAATSFRLYKQNTLTASLAANAEEHHGDTGDAHHKETEPTWKGHDDEHGVGSTKEANTAVTKTVKAAQSKSDEVKDYYRLYAQTVRANATNKEESKTPSFIISSKL